tara:strand:- start:6076 stop:8193 length:2118 start_codon:yes stop_codon:yes gene_type:complete
VKKYFLFKQQLFFILTSIFFSVYLLGFDYINPSNIEWLSSGDLTQYQLGWKFFRADNWRFPLGENPNFGMYYNTSIIFSDSIPLFAIFFKLIKFLLPLNFQYFSLWILVCIYLQLYFSFKIIHGLTSNLNYALIGSLFFCISTIFINRSGIHLALMGHWLILQSFYIEGFKKKNKIFHRIFNLSLSVLVNFYFTIIIIFFYFFNDVFKFFKKEIKIKEIVLSFFPIVFLIFILMYCLGYFVIKLDDGLGWGYGFYNFNLNSFFNPSGFNNASSFNWSIFLPTQNFQNGEQEGLSYLGIVGIFFLFLFLISFFLSKKDLRLNNYKTLFVSLIFLILAISNNINFGDNNIISIPLHNLIYALLSSIRSSGRLIWPVYYLIFIFGIILLYDLLKNKKPTLILFVLLIFHIIDLSPGLMNYKFGKQYLNSNTNIKLKSNIWKDLSNRFERIRLIEPKNNSNIFKKLDNYILEENYKATDIAYLARVNRDTLINKKYELVNLFNDKDINIFKKSLFISDNINYVRNLYYLYGNKIHYYYEDNLWLISLLPLQDNKIKDDNKEVLSKFYQLQIDKNSFLNLKDTFNSPIGFGWQQIDNSNKIILDGYSASILFSVNGQKCNKNSKIKFILEKYYKDDFKSFNLKTYIDNKKSKDILITKNINEIIYNFECTPDKGHYINLNIENPVSLYDLKKGLNREKRSVILTSIEILR